MKQMDDYISDGYILLARKIRKSPLWRSLKASHRIVMIELLLQAQFKDGDVARNGEILHLKRGQIATSYQLLVNDIGDKNITVKVVRNAINKLVKYDFLAKDEAKTRAKKGLLLTIANYDVYQNTDSYKGKVKGKDTDKEEAKQGQSKGKEGAINNNDNNVNNANNDIPYKDIVDYLNLKTSKNYKHSTNKTKSLITARWNEGFALDDFKKVIDNKTTEWLNDSKMSKYLRPETLFGNKFEGYLNEEQSQSMPKAYQSMYEWLNEEGEDEQTRDRPIDVDSYS